MEVTNMDSTTTLLEQPVVSYDTELFVAAVNEAYQRWRTNPHYDERCQRTDAPERVSEIGDLYELPTVDMAEFKGGHELTVGEANGVLLTSGTSSGTRGRVPRTEKGFEVRQQISEKIAATVFPDVDAVAVVSPAPDALANAPEVVADRYIFNIIPSYFEQFGAEYFVDLEGGEPEVDMEALAAFIQDQDNVGLVGVPSKLYPIIQHLAEMDLSLGEQGYVGTGGGWKGMDGVSTEQFRSTIAELSADATEHVDVYAATEFTGLFANRYRSQNPDEKRVPSQFFVYTADEEVFKESGRIEPTDTGEPGLLTIIDPLNLDAPGVIFTDDIVRKTGGVYGPDVRLEYIGRSSL